jgi:hypothetical protein
VSKRRQSIAEWHGPDVKEGYKFVFRSSDPAQISDEIRELKASHAYPGIRSMVLTSIGAKEHANPEYMIITGCVRVFDSTQGLRSYFTLLDKLDVKYTFLRHSEYCSMLPALHTASTEQEWDTAWQDAREMAERNYEQARPLGVKNLVYFCSDSYSVAQRLHERFGLESEPLFYLDILVDRLEGRALRLEPTVVGFFPGCWRERRMVNPNLEVKPQNWRSMLERIEGVRVVEMSAEICCKEDAATIVRQAEELGADCIVTPCHGVGQAKFRNLGKLPALTVSDLLLKALAPRSVA